MQHIGDKYYKLVADEYFNEIQAYTSELKKHSSSTLDITCVVASMINANRVQNSRKFKKELKALGVKNPNGACKEV